MQLAVSTDMLVEGRHFLSTVAPDRLGHKALAVNLSDLAACGARPLAFTLALALPESNAAFLEKFARGLHAIADRHDCELVGGDTTRGPLTISIAVFGEVPAGTALLRSGAKTGRRALRQRHARRCPPGARGLSRQRSPCRAKRWRACAAPWKSREPRVALGVALRGVATSAIDVSDGLAGDLGHILRRSGVGAVVDVDALPHGADLAAQPRSMAPRMPARRRRRLRARLQRARPSGARRSPKRRCAAGTAVTRIGRIEPGSSLRFVDAAGRAVVGPAASFDHFRAAPAAPPS